jgi:transposase
MVAFQPSWSLHGVALLSAISVMPEVGDFRRFTNPHELVAWVGLGATRTFMRRETQSPRPAIAVPGGYWWKALLGPDSKFSDAIGFARSRQRRALESEVRTCARCHRLLGSGRYAVAIARELAADIVLRAVGRGGRFPLKYPEKFMLNTV